MATVTYTEHKIVRTSEAVKGLWYDQNNNTLTVQLTSGGYYTYSGVTRAIYERLLNADSVGREFSVIKRNHGPGKRLHGENLNLVPVGVTRLTAMDRSASPATIVNGPHITLTSTGESRFTLGNSSITGSVQSVSRPNLRHIVTFTIEGSNERTFETQAQNVDDAVKNLAEALAVVGLNAKIKTVVTHFE